jgi:hypothetical protein
MKTETYVLHKRESNLFNRDYNGRRAMPKKHQENCIGTGHYSISA